jgi:lipid-binding SYLF domain-containing protein
MSSSDVLTYSRSKGLFAGVSLEGASMTVDNDANKKLYGKEVGAKEIVTGAQTIVPTAQPLVSVLNATSPTRK